MDSNGCTNWEDHDGACVIGAWLSVVPWHAPARVSVPPPPFLTCTSIPPLGVVADPPFPLPVCTREQAARRALPAAATPALAAAPRAPSWTWPTLLPTARAARPASPSSSSRPPLPRGATPFFFFTLFFRLFNQNQLGPAVRSPWSRVSPMPCQPPTLLPFSLFASDDDYNRPYGESRRP